MPRLLLFVVLTGGLSASTAHAQKVYWVEFSPGTVRRADLDGAHIETLLSGQDDPVVIGVDPTTDRMYWNEMLGGRLNRSDLDGLVSEELPLTPVQVNSLALDPLEQKLYWVEFTAGRIRRADSNGTGVQTLVSGLTSPTALALDLEAGHLYWNDYNKIYRSTLEGLNGEIVFDQVEVVSAMAFDTTSDSLYWTTGFDIRRNGETLIARGARGIALDPPAGKLYYTDLDGLWRANLDGSDIELVVAGSFIRGVALDPRECSGHGQRLKGQCVCDPGWEGDNCGCSTSACPGDCLGQGECICGLCVCDAGWGGEDCGCSTECPGDCSGHGTCDCGTCVCDDGYGGEDCSCFLGPCPNDCSGRGTCDCGVCICDAGWDGPDCSCVYEECPNDCSGHGTCVCGVCACDPGWFEPDCSAQTTSPFRVFLAVDGLQGLAAPMGPTTYLTPAGERFTMNIWLEDVRPQGDRLNAYQIILPYDAAPQKGAQGAVSYVDDHPGYGGGDSVVVDAGRADWVFSVFDPALVSNIYNETPPIIFGIQSAAAGGFFVDTADLAGIRYLGEFELDVSSDASGEFQFVFNEFAPFSSLFDPDGAPLPVDEFQVLRIIAGAVQPMASAPPGGSIDARRPQAGADGPQIVMTFNGPAEDVSVQDFGVQVSGGAAPGIADIEIDGQHVTLRFDRALPPGECTTIDHLPSDWQATIRSLPGDIDGDGRSAARDILALINHLNGVQDPPLEPWQCDIDWSGGCEPLDIVALIDLLNGAGGQQAWLGAEAPVCP